MCKKEYPKRRRRKKQAEEIFVALLGHVIFSIEVRGVQALFYQSPSRVNTEIHTQTHQNQKVKSQKKKKILKAVRKMTHHLQGKPNKISKLSSEIREARGSGTTHAEYECARADCNLWTLFSSDFMSYICLSLSVLYDFFHYSPRYLLMVSEFLCRNYFITLTSTNSSKFSKIVLDLPSPLGLSMYLSKYDFYV